MLLSEIVNRVNAKSFGETTYTYDEIYPYFQEAIDSLNSQMNKYRHIPNAPIISEDNPDYTKADYQFLTDMHINNYIVTYIVVAIDNASLASTSRTQVYAAQVQEYAKRTIADLYKFMPINGSTSNLYFDFSGNKSSKLGTPNVKIWYDEFIGGQISCLGAKAPDIDGIKWDNPYGTVSLSPEFKNYKLKEGVNYIPYIFTPNEYFRPYYGRVMVSVPITGYLIDYEPPMYEGEIEELGTYTSFNTLMQLAWARLKSNGQPDYTKGHLLFTGAYIEDDIAYPIVIMQSDEGILYLNTINKYYYIAKPLDPAQPTEFNRTKLINFTFVTKTGRILEELNIDEYPAIEDITYDLATNIKSTAAEIGKFNFSGKEIILYSPTHLITSKDNKSGVHYFVGVDNQNVQTDVASNSEIYYDKDTIYSPNVKAKGTVQSTNVDASVIVPPKDSHSTIGNSNSPYTEGHFEILNADNVTAGTFNGQETRGNSLVADNEIDKLKYLYSKEDFDSKFQNLQNQVDGINEGQNLADIVDSYATLSSYNSKYLRENDKIQVLVDETKEDASTVYNWDGSKFNYIGPYGQNSYTKTQVDEFHNQLTSKMNTHETDVNAYLKKQDEKINVYKSAIDNSEAEYKADMESVVEVYKDYVDESIGIITDMLDKVIGSAYTPKEVYVLTSDATFIEGKTYYTKSVVNVYNTEEVVIIEGTIYNTQKVITKYIEAEVIAGEVIPSDTYYEKEE